MGAVYLCRDVNTGNRYAVKIMRDDLSLIPTIRERFLNESKAAMRIVHPGVAQTYEIGELSTGAFFIIMELVEGGPLRKLMRKGPMSQTRVTILACSICEALAAAHEQGVIHRDLKPENVLIPRCDPRGTITKLVDFGVARILDTPRITTTRHVLGTPQYISPEQAMGGPVDARADIYALGVMMYEMLCGALPFRGRDPESLLLQHIKNPPTPMLEQAIHPPVSVPMESIVMSCLEKSPNSRPQNVAVLLSQLGNC
jgi:serine/threonine-protein kinase